ncbi:MAG: hypothetical protein AB7S57_00920 [Acetobacteraceae bacterium]
MAKSGSAAPRPDATDKALHTLAESVVEAHFADPVTFSVYDEAFGRKRGRQRIAPAQRLMRELYGEDSWATIAATQDKWTFDVTLEDPVFTAHVTVSYAPEQEEANARRVESFTGDRRRARKRASEWCDEVDDDMEELMEVLMGLGKVLDEADDADGLPVFDDDDPGEPPPATPADATMIQRIARSLAQALRSEGAPVMSPDDEAWFEATPQSIWPILDSLVAACSAPRRDEPLITAYRFLLGQQLEFIRYRIDSGWDWAKRMAAEYQQRLIAMAESRSIPQEDWFALVAALGEAKIEVEPAIREQLAEAGGAPEPGDVPAELMSMLRELMDQMAETAPTPFDVVEAMSDTAQVMPAGMRTFLMHEMAHATQPVLRDSVTLMLLDPEQEVRRAAAAVLEQFALPETLSPESLRRMIAIRSWLPEADRPALDRAVRKARTKEVACAQWPAAADVVVTASMIDGSGAQTFTLTTRGGRRGVFASVLLKQGFGIRDTWFDPDLPRSEINKLLATIRRETPCAEVDRALLNQAVQHAIATGLGAGHVSPATLLRIAEFAGGDDWRDRSLDIPAEIEAAFEALDPEDRGPDGIAESLRRSGTWRSRESFAASWFEDDAAIRAVLARAPKRDKATGLQLLLEEGLPPGRMVWAERFLLLALWAGAAREKDHAARRRDFVILAHELAGERPLPEIPFMVEVAEQTLMVGRASRW